MFPQLSIAVFHHPFSWLTEFDRNTSQELLFEKCNFILHGHEHNPKINVSESTLGDVVTIPAGAAYSGDGYVDPRYINSYNYVSVDLESGTGSIFFRRWVPERHTWMKDEFLAPGGGRFDFNIPKYGGPLNPERNLALNLLKSRMRKQIQRRFVEMLEIVIRVTLERHGNIDLVKVRVRYKGIIAKGETEDFRLISEKDENLQSDMAKNGVKAPYFNVISFSVDGLPKYNIEELPHSTVYKVKLPNTQANISYYYEVYQRPDDAYILSFGRVTRKIKLHIYKDQNLVMTYHAVGGCPMNQPIYDDIHEADVVISDEMCFPNQGYIIFWRRYDRLEQADSKQEP